MGITNSFSDQLFNYVMDSTPYAIGWKDLNFVFRGCNENFAHFFGFKSSSEITGKLNSDIVDDPAAAHIMTEIDQRGIQSGAPEHFTPIQLPIRGIVREILTNRIPLKNTQGNIYGFLIAFKDVTEEYQALRDLKEARKVADHKLAELKLVHEELRRNQASLIQTTKMASLGVLASGLAHEINNPLTIVKGKMEEMLLITELGTATPESLLRCSTAINVTVDRIAKIISGLRTFARDSSDDETEEKDVRVLIDETLSFCATKFLESHIQVKVNYPPGTTSIRCRPVQISQVLLNLLNNSHDAISDSSGLPDLPALNEKWIQVEARSLEDGIEISVTDSGKGISPEVASRVMEPFFTTKDVGKGTGLGLSISQGILESHKGKIYLDQKSRNTRFAFWLPF